MRLFPKPVGTAISALSLLVALLLALPAVAAACGESAPPQILDAQVTPASLPWEGGTIKVTTEVSSDCGPPEIYAEVMTSGGLNWSFQMLASSDPNLETIFYRAEIGAPPNYDQSPFYYEITIRALDLQEGTDEQFAGVTELAGAPQFDEAPYVSGAMLSPAKLGTEGGWVTISADISDNRSVAGAFAIVTLPDETQKEVWMEPVSSSHFVGYYKAPPNFTIAAKKYSVVVYGEDDAAQRSSESAGAFTVAARPGPLSAVAEGNGNIGNVTVGRTATRLVTVHNSGTKWIKSTISLSGASSFALRGSTGGKTDFQIGPGETRYFRVDFTPTALGPASATVTVSRVDGAQPAIVLPFTGKGIAPAS
jgi:hypothetical protein